MKSGKKLNQRLEQVGQRDPDAAANQKAADNRGADMKRLVGLRNGEGLATPPRLAGAVWGDRVARGAGLICQKHDDNSLKPLTARDMIGKTTQKSHDSCWVCHEFDTAGCGSLARYAAYSMSPL